MVKPRCSANKFVMQSFGGRYSLFACFQRVFEFQHWEDLNALLIQSLQNRCRVLVQPLCATHLLPLIRFSESTPTQSNSLAICYYFAHKGSQSNQRVNVCVCLKGMKLRISWKKLGDCFSKVLLKNVLRAKNQFNYTMGGWLL